MPPFIHANGIHDTKKKKHTEKVNADQLVSERVPVCVYEEEEEVVIKTAIWAKKTYQQNNLTKCLVILDDMLSTAEWSLTQAEQAATRRIHLERQTGPNQSAVSFIHYVNNEWMNEFEQGVA